VSINSDRTDTANEYSTYVSDRSFGINVCDRLSEPAYTDNRYINLQRGKQILRSVAEPLPRLFGTCRSRVSRSHELWRSAL